MIYPLDDYASNGNGSDGTPRRPQSWNFHRGGPPPSSQAGGQRRVFPDLSGNLQRDEYSFSIHGLWDEVCSLWLVSSTPPLDTEIPELIAKWDELLVSCLSKTGNAESVDSVEQGQPIEPAESRAYAALEGADIVQRFLDKVEDVFRSDGDEPPPEFFQLSAQLALLVAGTQAEYFAEVVAERREAFDNPDADRRKPCLVPGRLAATWRREDPSLLKQLLQEAEADAAAAHCSLPVPAYRLATCYALAIARREEAWASFYSNEEDLCP